MTLCATLSEYDSCLTQKISVSQFHCWKGEQILDFLITMGSTVTTTTTGELDCRLVQCLDVGAAQVADHWTQLGAKPEALVSSSPSLREPGTAACKNKQGPD